MSKRATLTLLALLFFGPLCVAWVWFFQFRDLAPAEISKGDLIDPPVALAGLSAETPDAETARPFDGAWTIVLLAPHDCDTDCEQALYLTRQVRTRLNKDADRVQRVLLAGRDVMYPVEQHPDLRVFVATDEVTAPFLGAAPGARVWLVDPRGFLMMSYPQHFTPEMLHSDLKRLLKYSDAG